jgi:hypothetical protein
MGMRDKYVGWPLKLTAKPHSALVRILALAFGVTLFLVVIAWLLMAAAAWLAGFLGLAPPAWLNTVVGAVGLAGGGILLIWATWSHWNIGGGTPNMAAPIQKLIVKDPINTAPIRRNRERCCITWVLARLSAMPWREL